MPFSREQIAARAAEEIAEGSVVNLGIGLPTLIANYLDADFEVHLHSENGLLGMGPMPWEGEEDPQLINAGKQTVTVLPGGSFFDSAMSFAMIRGGHIDQVFLGAMQVSQHGDLANWSIPGGRTMGIGGAMDLATGCKDVIVLMTHCSREGKPKLVRKCHYPLTAKQVVRRVISDLGVLDPSPHGFKLIECAPGVTVEQMRQAIPGKIVA